MNRTKTREIVSRDPEVMSGALVFTGTRVPVELLGLMEEAGVGSSLHPHINDYGQDRRSGYNEEVKMSRDEHDTGEVTRCGGELYERIVRPKVEGETGGANDGRFVALDVESGDYEVADEALAATVRLRQRRPDAVFYLTRVGRPAAFRMRGKASTRSAAPAANFEPGRSS